MSIRQKILDKLVNFYPPYLGAGIKLTKQSSNYQSCRVEMPLRLYNRNYVGTHFGGSLYSMVDPWYMIMLMKILGKDYIVWDKAATIRFKRPGKGTVHADFEITDADLAEIREHLKSNEKMDKNFFVQIKDKEGYVIAEVDKLIYIKRKK